MILCKLKTYSVLIWGLIFVFMLGFKIKGKNTWKTWKNITHSLARWLLTEEKNFEYQFYFIYLFLFIYNVMAVAGHIFKFSLYF